MKSRSPLKEIGEMLIDAEGKEYFFRPSFINMTRIGDPSEIVAAFYDLHHDEVAALVQSAQQAFGLIFSWLIEHIKSSSYGRKALMSAMDVMTACCDEDVTPLIGEMRQAKAPGKAFKMKSGAMDAFEIIVIAQSLISHGVIGKAKVRKLQRHENNQATPEFNAFEYISAARNHFSMSRAEAEQLTMTEFQLLIAAKYPDQKGFTKDEYDAIANDYLAKKAKRIAKSK
ncbi:DUF6246 family protein [Enterobacter asburiae]|nr:DUF6246 family protein [Enterobacter asburiae]